MGRGIIIFTTLIGGVGLGLAVGYLLLVVAAFHPEGARIAEFMVGTDDGRLSFGFALVAIPYVLLLLHLWLRVRVATLLIERGELDLAEKFARARLSVSLMRSRREALANRVALMRIALRRGDYDEVEAIALPARLPRQPKVVAPFHRYRLEAALRRENLIQAREIVESAWPLAADGEDVAAFCACAGELAVRNGDEAAVADWRQRAEFAAADSERLMIMSAFAAAKFATSVDEARQLEQRLAGELQWLADVPQAAGEVLATRATLLAVADDETAARKLLDVQVASDARSQFVLDRVRARWSEPPTPRP